VKYTAAENIPGGKGWSPFRSVNAGAMVGPAGLMRRMLAYGVPEGLPGRPVHLHTGASGPLAVVEGSGFRGVTWWPRRRKRVPKTCLQMQSR